jgi:uncharacterized membrane protein
MTMAQHKDPHLDIVLSLVLLIGSLIGIAIITLGLVISLIRHPDPASVVAASSLPFSQILPQILSGNPLAILDGGLVILMLTPILRVGMALYQFWREGDRRYTWVSAGVLLVLLVSLFLARG